MRILTKTSLFLTALAVIPVSPSYNVLRAQGIGRPTEAANHALSSEVRTVDAGVVIIKLNGPVNLQLTQGATPAMTVRAEPRLLPKIRTAQAGNTLEIDTKGVVINVRQPMAVELTLPALQQLQVLGSGNSQVSGFSGNAMQLILVGSGNVAFHGQYRKVDARVTGSGDLKLDAGNSENVELAMLGSGNITASGASKAVSAKLQGSGELNAGRLVADTVSVASLGSGDAMVFARKAVSLALSGSGDITVYGKPAQRSVSTSGSGAVSWE